MTPRKNTNATDSSTSAVLPLARVAPFPDESMSNYFTSGGVSNE